jgi:pimeloyl-ACP methyl ester carboxylesterase
MLELLKKERRRILLGLLGVFIALLALNTVLVDRQTAPARPDIGKLIRLPSGDLQWRRDGTRGPQLVLLPGLSESMHVWDRLTGPLARRDRVIRFDLLGHGGSAKPSGGYAIEDQAHRLDQALKELRVNRAVLVGHSLGGLVAVALSRRDPGLVRRLVLIDAPPTESSRKQPLTQTLATLPVLGEAAWRLAPDSMLRNGLESAFAPGYPVPDQSVRDLKRMTYTSFADSAKAPEAFLKTASLPGRLSGLRPPVLAIFGSEDQRIAHSAFGAYRGLRGVRIQVISGAGHTPIIERPRAVVRSILHFVGPSSPAPARPPRRRRKSMPLG